MMLAPLSARAVATRSSQSNLSRKNMPTPSKAHTTA